MRDFYMDIQVDSQDAHVAIAAMLRQVHRFNAPKGVGEGEQKDHPLAVGFPAFAPGVADESGRQINPPRAGSILRVFGSSEALEAFAQDKTLARLRRMGMARVHAPSPVPPAHAFERFERDRRLQKSYRDNAYARRQQARAQKQGRDFAMRSRSSLTDLPDVLRFEIASSAGQKKDEEPLVGAERVFLLDVRKKAAAPGESLRGRVNSYGLCAQGAAIPVF